MKEKIVTIHDALSYYLQGMYYAETKLTEAFTACLKTVTSTELQNEMRTYIETGADKILKLERIFNYLMQDATERKNEVIVKMIEETHHMLTYASATNVKDILMIGCFQSINAYKSAGYKTAYLFSIELELETVADLLSQIIEWEAATGKSISSLAVKEFNRINSSIKL